MPNYIVRPTSQISGTGLTASAGTVLACVGDNSDTTFVWNSGASLRRYEFGLGAPTIPTDEYVAKVAAWDRWRQSTSAPLYQIGMKPYRSTDDSPASLDTFTPNNQAAFGTTELPIYVGWTRAEVGSLRVSFRDGRATSGWPQTDHADLGAKIYTIKQATATSANLTSSASKPTFSISVTGTIDWEASDPNLQLRVIEHQVWIESGGTTPGTGTFVGTISQTAEWTATGTRNFNLQFDRAIPNGTYRFYVRAIRRRSDGTSSSESIGPWSTGYTLTQSVPLPTTPTRTVTFDQTNDKVDISVTPVATTGYTAPVTIDIERSDDGGTTWAAIRGGTGVSGAFGSATVVSDYEAPRGVTVNYRARVTALYTSSGFNNSSNWTASSSGTITATGWNLKVPETPALNDLNVTVIGSPTDNINEDLGVFRPLGSTKARVVAGDLTGWDGELNIYCLTSADWTSLKAIITAQKVLLLESPFGWSKYIRIVNGAQTAVQGTPTTPRRPVSLTYVETAAP